MSSFQNRGAHRICLLLFRRFFGLCGRGFRCGILCFAHPINLLHELPIKPAQTTRHLTLLRGALSGEGRNVPQWMVCNVARKTYEGAR